MTLYQLSYAMWNTHHIFFQFISYENRWNIEKIYTWFCNMLSIMSSWYRVVSGKINWILMNERQWSISHFEEYELIPFKVKCNLLSLIYILSYQTFSMKRVNITKSNYYNLIAFFTCPQENEKPLPCWIFSYTTLLPIFSPVNLQYCIKFVSMYFQSMWKTVWILIRWLHQKPSDLYLQCLQEG